MSETELHRRLIRSLSKTLQAMIPGMTMTLDLQNMPGQRSTPNIHGFRPDVFGHCTKTTQCLIGEAKTASFALQSSHFDRQVKSFLSFLEAESGSMFFLASPGELAYLVRTTLSFLQNHSDTTKTRMFVFDSLDLWELAQDGSGSWRLH